MRPLRIVARGYSEQYRQWSRHDLRSAYRRLRTEARMTPFQARSLITDIVLSGDHRRPQR